MLLKFLLDRAPLDRHPGYGCIASALVAHLRTVRALELTLDVWKVGLSSLVKAEQAKKLHIVRKIENLLRVMVRESQDIKSRHLQAFHAHLQAFPEGRSSAAVAGIAQMVKEACEMDGSADAGPQLCRRGHGEAGSHGGAGREGAKVWRRCRRSFGGRSHVPPP
jgi:hypothetical protein